MAKETMELRDVMLEAEGWLDSYLQGETEADEWLCMEGGGEIGLAGKTCDAVWLVVSNTRLPEIRIRDGADVYTVDMKRTACPDVIVYEWQCWDGYGLSRAVDEACRERGRIIFP